MICWHLLSFSKLSAIGLFFIFPVLFFSLVYLVVSESCVVLEWEIFSFDGLSFCFPILLDKVGVLFSCVVVVISFSVMLFRISYMSGDVNLEYFIYMVLLFVLSMNFLIYIPHLLFLLLGWDGLGLTSYLLVIYYQNDKSLGAGIVTAMSNRIGDSLLILAACWCFVGGVWVFGFSSYRFLFFSGVCVFVGAMTKRAQVPFSAWLPAAMAAPTPVSSLVHSSTLVTAGVYLIIRFYPSLRVNDYFFYFVFYVGVVTCLMASFSALYENDLKKVVALSTLSQLGVIFMALGLGFPMLAFFHLITHALFKALLFVCAGTVIHSMQNNQDIRLMGGLWSVMPVTCTSLNVANLALCGFPFMAGFYSKDLIVESFMYRSFPVSTSVLMVLSVCLTGGYSVRLSVYTLWSPYKGGSALMIGDESVVTYYSFFILLLGAVIGGGMFSWFLCPFVGVIVLPVYLKVLALSFLFFIGFVCYFLVEMGCRWVMVYFMGSMWFLGFITSSPNVGVVFSLGKGYYIQEMSWIEVLRGKGLYSFFSLVSSSMQKLQDFTFSKMFSLFTLLFGIILFIY